MSLLAYLYLADYLWYGCLFQSFRLRLLPTPEFPTISLAKSTLQTRFLEAVFDSSKTVRFLERGVVFEKRFLAGSDVTTDFWRSDTA